jgi:hypothetical protein
MVRTLKTHQPTDAQAFIMTGIRGTGKRPRRELSPRG